MQHIVLTLLKGNLQNVSSPVFACSWYSWKISSAATFMSPLPVIR